ncbi:tripartite tricarboxylate transporter TctB family protein [Roseinatronobacter sp. S2]|uniref:tripartite tricarboxylate transporter TctB family protein n=1 Tax=Roseinatronobacter sp. S2 TaxID=3035471 RepID=UPI00240EF0BD|nr:tripartite tricarboxylate transporter TctB family protein [Roseinatronobacter sp. S2]WFE76705.1 tripartite tricarboxylate transporter TctB family protein [Roseinatronobacter sp. S2]
MFTTDRLLGVGLVLLGSAGILNAMQISVRTFNDDPGPKLFPILACGILVICGIGMILTRNPDAQKLHIPKDVLTRGLTMAALLGAYAMALWLAGFYVATLVMGYAFYHVIAGPQRRHFWRGLIFVILMTGAVHMVFAVGLNAYLPRGLYF